MKHPVYGAGNMFVHDWQLLQNISSTLVQLRLYMNKSLQPQAILCFTIVRMTLSISVFVKTGLTLCAPRF